MKKILEEYKIKVDKVISVNQMKKQYWTEKSQLDLRDKYGTFLIETSYSYMIPDIFKPKFLKHRTVPTVNLGSHHILKTFDDALNGTYYYPFKSDTQRVKIGYISQSSEELAENTIALMKDVTETVCHGSENILSVWINCFNPLHVPVFSAIPLDQ